jgi:hypothetical protein
VRLILSRKGFDAAHGGVPSPIFPDGSYVSLPIPDTHGNITYGDIVFNGCSLGEMVANLSHGKVVGPHQAHLDPDLDWRALRSRPPSWRPLFGQAGAAQAHLSRAGVAIGDLFLFFGWFREVEWTQNGWRYRRNAPDLHAIFGWLRVGEIWPADGALPGHLAWTAYHPHVNPPRAFKHNTLYVAAPEFDVPNTARTLCGGGLFARLRPELCLSVSGYSRSVWRLPGWFYPQPGRMPLSYHQARHRWTMQGRQVLLRTTSPGQEFVLNCNDYPEASAWLAQLFASETSAAAGVSL